MTALLRPRWQTRLPAAIAAVLGVAVGLDACGPRSEPGSAASPSSSTPTPSMTQLIAVLDSPFGTLGNIVRLVTADGIEVGSAVLPADAESVTASGRRVLIAGGGRLSAIGRDGTLRSLGDIPHDTATETVGGLIASPDGSQWIWSSVTQAPDGTAHSRLFLGGTA